MFVRLFTPLVIAALCTALLISADAAQAQDNLPCSTRTTLGACMAECTGENWLLECSCLWVSSESQNGSCPNGGVCCFNMPCEKMTGTSRYECLRQGGSPDGITPKHCGWTPQEGGGDCGCLAPLVNAGYTLQELSVVDSIDQFIPPFDCVCPYTTNEQWLRLDVCNPPGVRKLEIKVDFAKTSNDSVVLEGSLAVPADFQVTGASLVANIGGIIKGFALDAKGKAKIGSDQVQLVVKSKKGVVLAQNAKLTIRFEKGAFASSLVDDGIKNETLTNSAASVPVEIELAGTMFAKTHALSYTAKAGKTGKAK